MAWGTNVAWKQDLNRGRGGNDERCATSGKICCSTICLSNHRWLVAVFAAIAVTVGTQTASAADPIAIRLLHEAHVGADVDLEATGQNDPKAHFSWKLEQKHKGSKAKISDKNSPRTSFRADVPGLYVVQVTVKLGNLSSTATLSVSPTPADSLAIYLLHEAHVGADVDLEATGQNDPKAHFSWKLEQKPKGSKAKISDKNSTQTSFQADVPGPYVVQVTVKLGNLSATATLTVNPSCATDPLTPVKHHRRGERAAGYDGGPGGFAAAVLLAGNQIHAVPGRLPPT